MWRPGGPPENSLAAFDAACEAGYGVELDVRLSADGEAVVFHDDTLKRLTGRQGRVDALTAGELAGVRLSGTTETIPTLRRVLDQVGRRGVLLIELKTPAGREGRLERRVADLLADFRGEAMVIGFNPAALGLMRTLAPRLPRGLNASARVDESGRTVLPDPARAYTDRQLELAAPHVLIPGQDLIPSRRVAALRASGLPVATWTIRSRAEAARVERHADNIIFEGWRA
nr:glycerophosphodiester phosphodiesterase family protein [Caulobacter sp. 17J80-11]